MVQNPRVLLDKIDHVEHKTIQVYPSIGVNNSNPLAICVEPSEICWPVSCLIWLGYSTISYHIYIYICYIILYYIISYHIILYYIILYIYPHISPVLTPIIYRWLPSHEDGHLVADALVAEASVRQHFLEGQWSTRMVWNKPTCVRSHRKNYDICLEYLIYSPMRRIYTYITNIYNIYIICIFIIFIIYLVTSPISVCNWHGYHQQPIV